METPVIDHLFRHHYGKMVSVLTRIFGLAHLETIEDAVQDTFVKATLSWRHQMPEHPEAWLTKAAKNRVLDIFRQIKAAKNRESLVQSSAEAMAMTELFLDTEIEDSQLRMIFTACHPKLYQADQIAFALKTISGFSSPEIASALLVKQETVKKRLIRARKAIKTNAIAFEIPLGKELPKRLDRVLEVLYLIFNEGFHSGKQTILIRKELCGEAMRLCQVLLKNESIRNEKIYALFALMCFHAARLDSKVDVENNIVDLEHQDRSLWYLPLIQLGSTSMIRASESEVVSVYHLEAAIASEHIKASTFNETDWEAILKLHTQLLSLNSSPLSTLNIAVAYLQLKKPEKAYELLQTIKAPELNQRAYLYYGTLAEYYLYIGAVNKAITQLDLALNEVKNDAEKKYLLKKRNTVLINR